MGGTSKNPLKNVLGLQVNAAQFSFVFLCDFGVHLK